MNKKVPSWDDICFPVSFETYLQMLDDRILVDFFVETRVFHHEIKAGLSYTCGMCGYRKSLDKIHEDFPICPKCESKNLHAALFWRTSKDNYKPSCGREVYAQRVVDHMRKNYQTYFQSVPNEDSFFKFKYHFGESDFLVSFLGSSCAAASTCPILAVSKAALLCPYLWDGRFDWKIGGPGRSSNMRLTHLIYQLAGGE
jgi:DNA-directed RNA polymerase subunit RPC12/RpoP